MLRCGKAACRSAATTCFNLAGRAYRMPPDALVAPRRRSQHPQEESIMNRSIPLSLTLAVALASQLALGGCSKKEDVPPPAVDAAASAPSPMMAASGAPMDSASSVAASDAASAAMMAASDAAMAASR